MKTLKADQWKDLNSLESWNLSQGVAEEDPFIGVDGSLEVLSKGKESSVLD